MRSFKCAYLWSLSTVLLGSISAQQISDVYTSTWNETSLFAYQSLSPPVFFSTTAPAGSATITVSDATVYQEINGFGATLTDTAASSFLSLKRANNATYWKLLQSLFDPSDINHNAGLSFIRVPIGASDFSPSAYSLDDSPGDTTLANFSISQAANTVAVLKDIRIVNNILQVFLVPWSPPRWMKNPVGMYGGEIVSSYYSSYANYLSKTVSAFKSATGFMPYAVGIQNEPQHVDETYPTANFTVDDMGHVGTLLRSQLQDNGLSAVKIIGYEDNWNDAALYPVQLMQKYGSAFDGISFHCYKGNVSQQAEFTAVFPQTDVYFTECTGTFDNSTWWSGVQWSMNTLMLGSLSYGSKTALMWNYAADSTGGPELPNSDSCATGCRPVVTITGSSYTLNQEYYAMAHAQKAVLPKDVGGPLGKRIGVAITGGNNWALRVGAYVTGRASASDPYRYSLVVMNWYSSNGTMKSDTTTISFRGLQASYTFPVGVTTLSWYASPNENDRHTGEEPVEL